MFKKKQQQPEVRLAVTVISITPIKRGDKVYVHNGWNGYEETAAGHTLVLYTVDGVMNTKLFAGIWTLSEVKNWKWMVA